MRILDIIEGLNRFFTKKYPDKGHFIHILNVTSNPVSKIYKTYKLEVYYINKKSKTKELFITVQESGRFPDNEASETVIHSMLCSKIIEDILSNYNKLESYGIQ